MRSLTDDEVEAVWEHGFTVATDVLSDEELDAVRVDLDHYLPSWVEHCADPAEVSLSLDGRKASGFIEFPFVGPMLNLVGTHPVLRRNAQRILQRPFVAIEQSHLLAKYCDGAADVNQLLHCDYANHTLLYPTARSEYGHVATILYYTDVTADDGPTGVVSTLSSGDGILWPDHVSRAERPVYTMRTFHRGTKIRRRSGRIVHFIDFCTSGHPWMGINGWARFGDSRDWTRFVSTATPNDLALFGVPLPGDPYWDEEALAGVQSRYPDLDLGPYHAARIAT